MKINQEGFDVIFGHLNPAQQEAVNTLEGPVLTLAGPGTGKTQIIAARIANILLKTDTRPENILCLTYTDAGTIAMRNRLVRFIGAEAYRVHIFTFHAFCNKVIQENSDHFGVRGLDAISELEQKTWIRDIIDAFPKGHLLKRYSGEVYYDADRLLNLFQAMKQEDWSGELIRSKCDVYLQEIKDRDGFVYKKDSKFGKKGDPNPAYFEEVKRMNQLKSATETFESYQSLLKKNNRYDFADMILWVIQAFRTNQAMLLNYQEQYHYFLVDEFQDTSGSQNHLLEQLIDYWEKPNVFCVGDDDQSIFRFQGANVDNIHHFIARYQPKLIRLTDNYRSSQSILDAAQTLIRFNETRIDDHKVLVAKNAAVALLGAAPQVWNCFNPLHETAAVAESIQQLIQQGVQGKEIAVLYRNHKQADDLLTSFQTSGISVNTRRSEDILVHPLIRKLIHILRYLAAEHKKPHSGESYVYELLHFDFFKIDPLEIAHISVDLYRRNFKERTGSWREELKDAAVKVKPNLFTNSDPSQALTKASKLLEGWIAQSFNLTLQQLIENILNESGMLVQALTSSEKQWNMQVLHSFFDFIKAECHKRPKYALPDILETLGLMEEEGIRLPAERLLYAEHGVNFITAHASKGLEFEYVYLIGCNSNRWEKARKGNNQFKLPDNLFEINPAGETEENRRLFYVASTRAKKQLVLSFAQHDESGKELEKSRFVAEMEEYEAIQTIEQHVPDDTLLQFEMILRSTRKPVDKVNLFNNDLVDELLSNYSLSVTHLNAYLKCPTAFYFNNLIRVPAPMSSSMTFGSAVHFALEQLFKKMNLHPEKQFPADSELVADFVWYMRRSQDAFTDAEYKRRMEYGDDILRKFYHAYIGQWNKITSIERSYRNVVMEGVPLNGKLDKLEFDGNLVNVVDYKTGKFANASKKFKAPKPERTAETLSEDKQIRAEDRLGGDYWRQAVFYKLLLDYDKTKEWKINTVEFDFVEPDPDSGKFMKQKVMISAPDEEAVKEQIHLAYNGIKQKQFDQGCEEETCLWCNFVKDYYGGE